MGLMLLIVLFVAVLGGLAGVAGRSGSEGYMCGDDSKSVRKGGSSTGMSGVDRAERTNASI